MTLCHKIAELPDRILFAGLIVPLPLFPDWLQPFLYWQPFRGMADVPFHVYSGHIPVDVSTHAHPLKPNEYH